MKKIIISLLMAFLSTTVFAYTAKIDKLYYNFSGDNAIVTYYYSSGYNKTNYIQGDVVIPSTVTYNGKVYTVTTIGQYAFRECGVTSVTIPETVTTIESDAFQNGPSIATLNIPKSVTNISSGAFYESNIQEFTVSADNPCFAAKDGGLYDKQCKKLLAIPAESSDSRSFSVPEGVESIGTYAFATERYSIYSVKTITLPSTLKEICESAFYFTNVTHLDIPAGITEVTKSAFSGASSLETVSFASPVTSIGDYAFSSTNLNSISLTSSLKSIGMSAFSGTKLTAIDIPSGVETIGANAFENCTGLTAIEIPSSVESIGQGVFMGCTGLRSVTLSDKLKEIPYQAFSGCTALTSISIPESVRKIGDYAFNQCSSLTKAEFASIEALCKIEFQSGSTGNPLSKAKHLYVNGSEVTDLVIPSSVTEIPAYAFYNCAYLTSVSIPESVTRIGKDAFYGCTALNDTEDDVKYVGNFVVGVNDKTKTSYTLRANTKGICANAFYNCTAMTQMQLPSGLVTIEESAFQKCTSLATINIPETVTTLGNSAFCNTALTNIQIPNTIKSLGSYLFSSTALTSVTIPEGVQVLGDYVFSYCSKLTDVELPSSLKTIGNSAFTNCTKLTSVVLPEGIDSIGTYAFNSCSSMTAVTIPSSVKTIGECAFSGCSKLTSVNYKSIESMCGINYGSYNATPMYYAKSMTIDGQTITELNIPEGVTKINNYAFYKCTGLTSVSIPSSVKYIGRAFDGCTGLKKVEYQSIDALCSIQFIDNPLRLAHHLYIGGKEVDEAEFPASLSSIPSNVLYGASYINKVVIPEGIKTIEGYAFAYCSSLESIDIPSSVDSIGESPLYYCNAMKYANFASIADFCKIRTYGAPIMPWANHLYINGEEVFDIDVPDGLTEIMDRKFEGCSSLKSITIPASVKSIGYHAFYNCNSLTDIKSFASNAPTLLSGYSDEINLHVPSGCKEVYAADSYWSTFNIVDDITRCATPTITIQGSKISFACDTKGAKFHYTIAADQISDNGISNTLELDKKLQVKVYATADGYAPSEEIVQSLSLLSGSIIGDVDGDGKVTVEDVAKVVNICLQKP